MKVELSYKVKKEREYLTFQSIFYQGPFFIFYYTISKSYYTIYYTI